MKYKRRKYVGIIALLIFISFSFCIIKSYIGMKKWFDAKSNIGSFYNSFYYSKLLANIGFKIIPDNFYYKFSAITGDSLDKNCVDCLFESYQNSLNCIPESSIVFSPSVTYPLYLQYVKGIRLDLCIVKIKALDKKDYRKMLWRYPHIQKAFTSLDSFLLLEIPESTIATDNMEYKLPNISNFVKRFKDTNYPIASIECIQHFVGVSHDSFYFIGPAVELYSSKPLPPKKQLEFLLTSLRDSKTEMLASQSWFEYPKGSRVSTTIYYPAVFYAMNLLEELGDTTRSDSLWEYWKPLLINGDFRIVYDEAKRIERSSNTENGRKFIQNYLARHPNLIPQIKQIISSMLDAFQPTDTLSSKK